MCSTTTIRGYEYVTKCKALLTYYSLSFIIIVYTTNIMLNYQQQLQANIEHLQMQCKPQLMTVRYTKLPTTINRPRKSVKF